MTVTEIEEEMRQHADKMMKHRAQTSQDDGYILRRRIQRAMHSDQLNEMERQQIQVRNREAVESLRARYEGSALYSSLPVDFKGKLNLHSCDKLEKFGIANVLG
ncbi:hypothetical protein SUGI_0756200 [Cryptomeria japonica]|nr:hypothetical protein SUGI_0756200 [Cryptomeria japonica]